MAVLPSSHYPLWLKFLRLVVRVFFAKVEVTGIEHVPEEGGGIIVAWHPNGLIDGLLILTSSPQPVVFGARDGLFKVPLLGFLLRSIGTVPLFRHQDASGEKTASERLEANRCALSQLAEAAVRHFVAIFPEGVTHDASRPQALRYGAARLWLMANQRTPSDAPRPLIVPVGLHYDRKHAFRARALVAFHPPIPVSLDPQTREDDTSQEAVEAITRLIERALADVLNATENWELHHLMHRARRLVRAERSSRAGSNLDQPNMQERDLGFRRVWLAYRALRISHPQKTRLLLEKVRSYSDGLRLLRINDHELDAETPARFRRRLPALVLEATAVFLFLPPFVLLGYAVSLPTALLLRFASNHWSKSRKEQAGIKLALGVIALPLTWLAVGILVGWARPSLWTRYAWTPQTPALAALVTFGLCAAGTGVALRYHRLVRELLSGLRTLVVRTRNSHTIVMLRNTRRALFNELMELSRDLDLPGQLAVDGSLSKETKPTAPKRFHPES